MSTPRLSVLVVSYRTRELTLACLRSLVGGTREKALEVIVVDNDSDDGSAEAVAREHPGVRLIALTRNVGFGAANVLAAGEARGDYLLLLNPDTVVHDGAVDRLLAFAGDRPEAGIWGGRTLFADGRLNPSSCWGAPTPWSALCLALGLARAFPRSALFNPEGLGGWRRDTEEEVPIVSGCFLLIRRALWDALEGFHPDFFMYGEDADLCLRAARHGARPRVTPAATIVHLGGASERVRADKMVRLFTAKARLFRRFSSPRRAILARLTLDLWALWRCSLFGLAAPVSKKKRESFGTWVEVWNRRGEWRGAFERAEPYVPGRGDAEHARAA